MGEMSEYSGTASSRIDYETLKRNFHLPMSQVAQELGVCATVLKKLCRQYNIPRWPHRKIKSLNKMITALEEAKCDTEEEERQRQSELKALLQRKADIMENPRIIGPTYSRLSRNANKPTKTINKQNHPASLTSQTTREKNVLLMLEQQRNSGATPSNHYLFSSSSSVKPIPQTDRGLNRPHSALPSAHYQEPELQSPPLYAASVPPKLSMPQFVSSVPVNQSWVRPIPVHHHSASNYANSISSAISSNHNAREYLSFNPVQTCFSPLTITDPTIIQATGPPHSVQSLNAQPIPEDLFADHSLPTLSTSTEENLHRLLNQSAFDQPESELCIDPTTDNPLNTDQLFEPLNDVGQELFMNDHYF